MAAKKKSTIIHEGSDKPLAQKARHYVDNKKFYEALVKRKQQVQKQRQDGMPIPKPDDYIGLCIIKIAEGLAKKYNFSRPKYAVYREEMIGDAIINCITYLDNFDPDQSKNPFSYFTQTCYFAFIRRIAEEDEEMAAKYKATIESATMGQLAFLEGDDAEHAFANLDVTIDNMENFVSDYDEKINDRKKAAKQKRMAKKRGLEEFLDEDDTDE